MKIVDKVEIEYVVPETEEERTEIAALIEAVYAEDGQPFDPTGFRKVKPNAALKSGYWRV